MTRRGARYLILTLLGLLIVFAFMAGEQIWRRLPFG